MKKLAILIVLCASSCLAQVQLGKGVQVGASGGVVPTGQQYKLSGFTGTGSGSSYSLGSLNATTDSTGNNLTVPNVLTGGVTNGKFNTDPYITSGGNNGLGNLEAGTCATGGCSTLFPATSTSTESPIPTVSNTLVQDYRGGGVGTYFYNPSSSGAGSSYHPGGSAPSAAQAFILNFDKEQLSYGDQNQLGVTEWLNFNAPGWSWGTNTGSSGFGLWAGQHGHVFQMNTSTPGIAQYQGGLCNKYSVGDSACAGYFYSRPDAGNTSPSDEGADGLGLHVEQNSTWFHGKVGTGATTGTKALPTTFVSGAYSRTEFAIGGYMLDTSRALLVNASVTGTATQMPNSGPWSFPVSATVTESTAWGYANAAIPTPVDPTQANTDTVNFTVTGGTNAGGYTAGKAWLDGAEHMEQVMITAVGAVSGGIQSVTFSHRYPNTQTGTYLFQGGTNGFYRAGIIGFGTTYGAWSTGYPVFGATDSSHLVGRFSSGANYAIPSFYNASTTNVLLTNLSVSGTTVTASVSSQVGYIFDGLQSAVISSASNSAYNGTVTNVHLVNDAQLQWTQTVTGTSNTAYISYPAINYQFNLFPGAEVTQPPATATPTIAQLEANDVTWTPNDNLENVQQASFTGALVTGSMYVASPDSQLQPGVGGIGYQLSGSGISGQFKFFSAGNRNPVTMYRGGGGLLEPPTGIVLQGPIGTSLNVPAPLNNHAVINIACALDGCSSTNSTRIISVNLGTGQMNYFPSTYQFYFSGVATPKIQANVLSTGDGHYVNGNFAGGAPVAITAASSASQNAYTSLGNYGAFGNEALLDTSADMGAHAYYAGTIHAGAEPPTPQGAPYVNGSAGTSTYSYEAVSNTQNGTSAPSTASTTNTGNATLSSSNSISIAFTPGKGAQSTDIYRTAAPAGYTLGRICTAVSNFNVGGTSTCKDTGQATTGSLPTTDTSGKLVVNGTGTINGSLICTADGTNCPASAGGVTQIIAGTNVTISPTGGTGAVTINSTGGSGLSGLTTNAVLKATSSTSAGNSAATDDGTTFTYGGTGGISANSFTSTDTTHNSNYTGKQAAGGVDVLPTQATGSSYITYLAATGWNEADGTGAFSPLTRAVDFAAGTGMSVSVTGKTVTYSATGASGIANTTITVGTTAIAANTCTTAATATMTGVATTSVFDFTPNADVSGVTGWGTTGGLTIVPWPTLNTLNYKVCNQTAASITPSASVVFNVGAR